MADTTNLKVDTTNLKSSQKTYSAFIGTLKWTVPLIAVIALIVIIIIS